MCERRADCHVTLQNLSFETLVELAFIHMMPQICKTAWTENSDENQRAVVAGLGG